MKITYQKNSYSCIYLILIASFLGACKSQKTAKNAASTQHSGIYGATHSHTESNYSKTKALPVKSTELVNLARNYMGVPYKFGGTNESGMDCSGLIYTVYQYLGLSFPRISFQQAEVGQKVDMDEIQIGDLLFFNTAKNSNQISHVGMVTEVEMPDRVLFIHSSTSKGVREDNLFTDYWKKAFTKATRPFSF